VSSRNHPRPQAFRLARLSFVRGLLHELEQEERADDRRSDGQRGLSRRFRVADGRFDRRFNGARSGMRRQGGDDENAASAEHGAKECTSLFHGCLCVLFVHSVPAIRAAARSDSNTAPTTQRSIPEA